MKVRHAAIAIFILAAVKFGVGCSLLPRPNCFAGDWGKPGCTDCVITAKQLDRCPRGFADYDPQNGGYRIASPGHDYDICFKTSKPFHCSTASRADYESAENVKTAPPDAAAR
jgi:hypothetical protein